ncbi:V-type proton ATPase subunit S1b [Betta splendens]|uniref:V-type proton ATPase subunit S1b n=1 Tax=Betta splendens TaxID=158456 RepID=A0A6P7N433_BETSP|nr:V-type proton ATPase subunit S1b [Betta splendens]
MAERSWRSVRVVAFICVFASYVASGGSSAQVPLLMWSSDGLPPLASAAAGHIASDDQLSSYLTSTFSAGSGSHTVLLFLQDKLSKEDFTVFGGVFGNKHDSAFQNLEAALRSSFSSVTLPALEWSGSSAILTLLQEKLQVSSLLVDADTLSDLSINTSVSNLLLISLPYCTSLHKSCKEVLHDNDEVVGKVLNIMTTKNVPYTAIYTGLKPSQRISTKPMFEQPMGRSLLQTVAPTVNPPIIFSVSGKPCIMLSAQNLNVSFTSPPQWTDLGLETPTLRESWCNSRTAGLVLDYASGPKLSFVMSRQFYSGSARYWFTLDSVQLTKNGQTVSFNGSRFITAPAEYSYHCQTVNSFDNPLLFPNTTKDASSQWMINLVQFQIQGFGLNNGTVFSYASDCAAFFTPGIWMGLLTTLIMLLILVYGLHMITQLTAMDRFDDPKGPTISVPQTE